MKLQVNKKSLADACALLTQIAAKDIQMLRFSGEEGNVILGLFDFVKRINCEIKIEGTVLEEGFTYVPIKDFCTKIGSLLAEDLEFEPIKNKLQFRGDDGCVGNIPIMLLSSLVNRWTPPENWIEIDIANKLYEVLNRVADSTTAEESSGPIGYDIIQFLLEPTELSVYAADKYRAAVSSFKGNFKPATLSITKYSSDIIKKVLRFADSPMNLGLDNNRFSIDAPNVKFSTYLSTNTLPDFRHLAQPEPHSNALIFNAKELKAKLNELASSFTATNSTLSMRLHDNLCTLTALGVAAETTNHHKIDYTGEDVTLLFNYNYIKSAIPKYGEVEMYFTTPEVKTIWIPVDDPFNSRYVVMPARI